MRRITQSITCGIASLCLIATASAQEVEQESTTTQQTEMTVIAGDGLASPMIFSTSENIGGDGVSSGIRIMSGGGGGMSFIGDPSGRGFSMPAPDPFSLLGNPSVQKDLELVGDQLKQVQDLQSEFAKQMRDQLGDLSKGGLGPERFEGIGELMKKLREEQKSQMEQVLLPHQTDRLRQVALQTHMKQSGTSNALSSGAVAEALNITDEQKETLKTRSEEINKKLALDIAKLRKDAKEGLLKEVLTVDQQIELKKMIGSQYEPQNGDWDEKFKKMMPNRTRRKMQKN